MKGLSVSRRKLNKQISGLDEHSFLDLLQFILELGQIVLVPERGEFGD
jgi:hypothetical protein